MASVEKACNWEVEKGGHALLQTGARFVCGGLDGHVGLSDFSNVEKRFLRTEGNIVNCKEVMDGFN